MIDQVERPQVVASVDDKRCQSLALALLPAAEHQPSTTLGLATLERGLQRPLDALGIARDAIVDNDVIQVRPADLDQVAVRQLDARAQAFAPKRLGELNLLASLATFGHKALDALLGRLGAARTRVHASYGASGPLVARPVRTDHLAE